MKFEQAKPAVLALFLGSTAATFVGLLTQAIYRAGSDPGRSFDFAWLIVTLFFGLLVAPHYSVIVALYGTPFLLGIWMPAWLSRSRMPAFWTKVRASAFGGLVGLGYFQLLVFFSPLLPANLHPAMITASYAGAIAGGSVMFVVGAHFHSRSHRSQ
jgi:hypothetical protein